MPSPVPVQVEFFPKKNSSGCIRDGVIHLRISQYLSAREKQQHIEHLTDRLQRRLRSAPPSVWDIPLEDGTTFVCFRQKFMLHISIEEGVKKPKLRRRKQAIFLTVSSHAILDEEAATIRKRLRALLACHFKLEVDGYVQMLNEQTLASTKLRKISLRDQRSRWGSCSSDGNISLSNRLLFLPERLLEYVVLHELCHLREMNHSARFWSLVEKFMLDYQERRRELKQYV